jgi:hypothetical protein
MAGFDLTTEDLKTWRFDPSTTADQLRITFSLEFVDEPIEDGVDVQFNLPERVNIRIGPVYISH